MIVLRSCRLVAALALFACVGCAEIKDDTDARTPQSRWNRISLPDAQPPEAFDAATYAVSQYFSNFSSSRIDGRIETPMIEYTQRGGTGRLRDAAFQSKNRMRHRATVVVSPMGDGSVALCEVRVQRLDTAEQRAFQQHREFDDVPNSTPIEGEASVSAAQSESWTEMPRDSQLERDILQIIFNRTKKQPAGTAGSAAASQPAMR